MNEIVLAGCTSTSLANYLKALGLFKLVAEQLDRTARAYWRRGHMVLLTRNTSDQIKQFLLHTYRPTPIISPWSGRAGFLEGDAGDESTRKGATALRTVSQSSGHRFRDYRDVIAGIKSVSAIAALDAIRPEVKRLEGLSKAKTLDEDGRSALLQVKKDMERLKDGLLVVLRSELDDKFVQWIDACFVIAGGEGTAAPLLGSGGNEGSMDFSINHVCTLLDLIDPNTDAPSARSEAMLGHALFAETQCFNLHSNIGFLSVASAGGVNMATGFGAHSSENLWNAVLVLEGAMLFAASATKKLESGDKAGLSFPFMVQPTRAGHGSIGSSEKARPELWLPVWTSPASLKEIISLASEGRSTLGSRQAKSGLDMLESLSRLGTNRGVSTFERFGFFERRGKGYFVTGHLGSYAAPREQAGSFITADLKQQRWLSEFTRFTDGNSAPARFLAMRRQLEDRIFDLAGREPTPAEMQSMLVLLGNIQQALAASNKAREAVAPIPRLSERWVVAADNGTPEFRIAKALAGLRGAGDIVLPLRAQIFPVQRLLDQWMTPDAGERVRICTARKGRLTAELGAWLDHRLWLMQRLEIKDKPLGSPAGAMLDDVASFLEGDSMDARIAALLPGLSLCDIPQDTQRTAGEGTLPAAFGLMKLTLTTDRDLRSLGRLRADEHLPAPTGMLASLMAGNRDNRAVRLAWRRLRSSGLTPTLHGALPTLAGIDPARAAAALLIPMRWGATAAVARALLDEPEAVAPMDAATEDTADATIA